MKYLFFVSIVWKLLIYPLWTITDVNSHVSSESIGNNGSLTESSLVYQQPSSSYFLTRLYEVRFNTIFLNNLYQKYTFSGHFLLNNKKNSVNRWGISFLLSYHGLNDIEYNGDFTRLNVFENLLNLTWIKKIYHHFYLALGASIKYVIEKTFVNINLLDQSFLADIGVSFYLSPIILSISILNFSELFLKNDQLSLLSVALEYIFNKKNIKSLKFISNFYSNAFISLFQNIPSHLLLGNKLAIGTKNDKWKMTLLSNFRFRKMITRSNFSVGWGVGIKMKWNQIQLTYSLGQIIFGSALNHAISIQFLL